MAESCKIGRGKRSPARARYKVERRWKINSARRLARHQRQMQRDRNKHMRTPRGSARAMRRIHLHKD